ncbi:hypothetical protein FQR65_LT05456 [Abscondita terminalis]|nr:hypothetical protein FQR65_LT05456 [Abscondita terminalis]
MDSNQNSVEKRFLFYKNCFLEWIPARVVLYLLTTYIMTIAYMVRIAINLSILAMVKDKPKEEVFNDSETLCSNNFDDLNIKAISYGGTLDWTLDQQYYVLTSFYWTYITSHFISGAVTQKYGTKKVCGWSLIVLSLCNLCVPFTSHIHYIIVVIVQSIQGTAQGFIWPGIYAAIAIWIPIHERSRFVTCFQGASLGVMLSNMMAGYTISRFGWVYVFYGTGGLGLLSALLWYLLMYDTPEQHPRISKTEMQYIKKNRVQSLHSENIIPWHSIITSRPVWAIAIISFGRMWILYLFLIYGPLYYKSVVIGHIMTAVTALIMGFSICDVSVVIISSYFLQAFIMMNFVGSMTNVVDISPSYTGPVSGFVQIILLVPTVLSTLVIKTLLKNENNLLAWRHTLYISSGVLVITSVFYAIFASAEVQPWDVAKNSDSKTKINLLADDKVKIRNSTPA